jgi:hypothetical protein
MIDFPNLVPKRLIKRGLLCEISSSHGDEYDVQSCLLVCTADILHGCTTQKTALNNWTIV